MTNGHRVILDLRKCEWIHFLNRKDIKKFKGMILRRTRGCKKYCFHSGLKIADVAREPATVHGQDGSVDIRAFRGGEKQHGVGDLFAGSRAAQGNVRQ
jgi:hypothetical protein